MQLHAGRPALLLSLTEAHADESAGLSKEGAGRIVFALDFPRLDAAMAFADRLGSHVGMLKVGLELFIAEGARAVEMARERRPVFLDLKLHDIPETVERAVIRCADLGARIVTVHASGGKEMLRRAAAIGDDLGIAVTAITVLTSLDDADLRAAGVNATVGDHAVVLAKIAFEAGVRSFVCSPHEAKAMRAALGSEVTLLTPGVRASVSAATLSSAKGRDDQKRVATAAEAIRNGADYVVVGRPIRDAADPVLAATELAKGIETACAGS